MNINFFVPIDITTMNRLLRRTLVHFVILIIVFDVPYCYQLFLCSVFQYVAPTELGKTLLFTSSAHISLLPGYVSMMNDYYTPIAIGAEQNSERCGE